MVAVSTEWLGDAIVTRPGRTTTGNATARPTVTLLWPPDTPGGYSLIVDGEATVDAGDGTAPGGVVVTPTRAVLHRPVPPPDPATGCESDCVPLLR